MRRTFSTKTTTFNICRGTNSLQNDETPQFSKLALFDIDGTLMKGSRLKDELAFPRAIGKVYGLKVDIDVINRHGMTDPRIIVGVLKKHGLDEKAILPELKECERALAEIFAENVERDEFGVFPGIGELLDELETHGVLTGLVTGNLEPIARLEVEKAGLGGHFKVGAFGSDNGDRAKLVELAIERAKKKFGFDDNGGIFLFGDTPKDVKAGWEAKVKTVGVATGIYSMEELKEAGADFVLENLRNPAKVLEIVFGQSHSGRLQKRNHRLNTPACRSVSVCTPCRDGQTPETQ